MTSTWIRIAREVLGEAGAPQATQVFMILYYEENRASRVAQMCGLDIQFGEPDDDTLDARVTGDQSSIEKFASIMGFEPNGGMGI